MKRVDALVVQDTSIDVGQSVLQCLALLSSGVTVMVTLLSQPLTLLSHPLTLAVTRQSHSQLHSCYTLTFTFKHAIIHWDAGQSWVRLAPLLLHCHDLVAAVP